MAKTLSPTMLATIAKANEHGGRLVRLPGGFWTYEGCPWNGSAPEWSQGTSTIHALVTRGAAVYTDRKTNSRGDFPVAIQIVTPTANEVL